MAQDDFVQRALELAKAGKKSEARAILKEVLQHDRENVRAWALMSQMAESSQEAVTYLQQVLRLRPGDEWASKQLARLENEQVTQQASEASPNGQDKKLNTSLSQRNYLVGCVTLALIIIACVLVFPLLGSQNEGPSEVEAWTVTQQFVENNLFAPASAKWPCCYTDFVADLGDGRYLVSAYVDSQNAFGASTHSRGM